MNNNEIDSFKKDVEGLRLTKAEKVLMRQHLTGHTKDIGVSKDIPSPFMSSAFHVHRHGMYVVVVMLLIVVIVPTAYAATQSLPGSPLYSIKTEVLEPLEETFAFSQERRIAVTIDNAENRIEETATLIKNAGKPEDIALASASLSEKIVKAKRGIDTLDTDDLTKRIDLQKDLLTVLETYSAVADDEKALDEATTTAILENTADVVEDDIRDSIDSFSLTAGSEGVADEVTDTIVETQNRLIETPDEPGEPLINNDQRKILETGLSSAQQELNEQDPSSALEALIFSDQDADVVGKLNEIQSQLDKLTEENSATSSVATSSDIQE